MGDSAVERLSKRLEKRREAEELRRRNQYTILVARSSGRKAR